MNLTGKCKEDFEKWMFTDERIEEFNMPFHFYHLGSSLQWGVIQDFADSKKCNNVWVRRVDGQFKSSSHDYFNTRQQARTAAIKKFNEIYNNERTNS